ncbi:hypothetical protein JB92DRAFT_129610 [Gautieria morchelliformis]|nr:hypothetical protein JB92DRAFT_129610 [Gautieria morchelliformis]
MTDITAGPVTRHGPNRDCGRSHRSPAVMSSLERFPKLLPYTTFVCSCVYYTTLFDIEWWKEHAKAYPGATFRSALRFLLTDPGSSPKAFPSQVMDHLLCVAGKVDALEELLSKNNLRRDDFGLGKRRGRPPQTLKLEIVRPFFVTLLLDRLLWGALDGFTPPRFYSYVHPHIQEGALELDNKVQKLYKIRGPDDLDKILRDFGSAVELGISNPTPVLRPSAQPPPPIPSTATTPAVDGGSGTDIENEGQGNRPDLQKPEVVHISVLAQEVNIDSLRLVFQAGANMAYPAGSAFFLINGDDPRYLRLFQDHVRCLDMPQEHRLCITQALRSFSEDHSSFPARIAHMMAVLATSPIVLLRDGRTLAERSYNKNRASSAHVFARCAQGPLASSGWHLSTEYELWKSFNVFMTVFGVGGLAQAVNPDGTIGRVVDMIRGIDTRGNLSAQCTPEPFHRRPMPCAEDLLWLPVPPGTVNPQAVSPPPKPTVGDHPQNSNLMDVDETDIGIIGDGSISTGQAPSSLLAKAQATLVPVKKEDPDELARENKAVKPGGMSTHSGTLSHATVGADAPQSLPTTPDLAEQVINSPVVADSPNSELGLGTGDGSDTLADEDPPESEGDEQESERDELESEGAERESGMANVGDGKKTGQKRPRGGEPSKDAKGKKRKLGHTSYALVLNDYPDWTANVRLPALGPPVVRARAGSLPLPHGDTDLAL